MASPARTRARLLRPGNRWRGNREPGPIEVTARLGKRTKDLVKKLGPADGAVIDHPDIDRMAAEDLIASGVPAVINVAPSVTGRYPNEGPLLLAEAGIVLVDIPGADLFEELRDGERIVIEGGTISRDGMVVAEGQVRTVPELAEELAGQRERVDDALAAFAENTMAHIRQEGELLAGRIELPATRTRLRDRHVLIVVRGPTYRKDLRTLRAYIHDVRPLLIGVDGGADAIIEAGLKPDIVLGDMDSASDPALLSGAELIVHAYSDGTAPGRERLEELNLPHTVVPAPGTSQDLAMLLAYEKGAALIVSVGAHFNLIEFLDKDREGMSSTFLTRLRIGEVLVDAKGVSRLYTPGIRTAHLAVLAAISTLLLAVVVLTSPALDNLLELLWLKLQVLLGI